MTHATSASPVRRGGRGDRRRRGGLRPTIAPVPALVLALALLVGGATACGGDDDGGDAPPTTAPPTTLSEEERQAIECAGPLSPDPTATVGGVTSCDPAAPSTTAPAVPTTAPPG
jgi:hypothetical protein